jgi:tRNA dimethylallyltransferase
MPLALPIEPVPASDPRFFLCGATASGKSAVASLLCQRIGGEIINADAFQLYRELDICTAKPSHADQQRLPHHLYSVLSPGESCDAQRYHDLAQPVITDIVARGRWPVIVGGSGLYVKSLTHGLAPLPKGDAALRERLAQMTAEQRIAELLRLDPEAPANVPLQNDRYVSRALEICLLTGKPQSELRQSWQRSQPEFMGVLLTRERDDLHHRINQRVVQMIQAGASNEVRELLKVVLGFSPHQLRQHEDPRPAEVSRAEAPDYISQGLFKAIGVREITAHLHGDCTLDQTIADIQQATRRYAKRQATWFKREHGFQTVCLAPDSTAESAVERILELFPCLLQPPPSLPSSST